MNIPAQIIAKYVSTEDCEIDPQQVWKSLEAVKMMVSIKNTNRLVTVMEKLNETLQKTYSAKYGQ